MSTDKNFVAATCRKMRQKPGLAVWGYGYRSTVVRSF